MSSTDMASARNFERHYRSFQLLPLLQHPTNTPSPTVSSLPSRPLTCPNERPFADLASHALDHWGVSTHVFPAAYPRSIAGSSLPPGTRPAQQARDLSGTDRVEVARQIFMANRDSQRLDHLKKDVSVFEEPQLFISVNRYYRKAGALQNSTNNTSGGLTLILSHANGLHKETWEPTLAHLLQSSESQLVSEIWALDCVNQGDSAILNKNTLGERFDWADAARDLLQFIISYLPDSNKTDCIPIILERQSSQEDPLLQLNVHPPHFSASSFIPQEDNRWRGRQIGLVGHSLGGFASALSSTIIPQLVKLLVLIDAVLVPFGLVSDQIFDQQIIRQASASVARRDQWKSRLEAEEYFLGKAEFFGRWDPAVLKRYLMFGLTRNDDSEVQAEKANLKLKCGRLHETSVFADPFYRPSVAFCRLKELSMKTRRTPQVSYVFPGIGKSVIDENFLKKHIEESNHKSDVIRLNQSSHLIVQEFPIQLSEFLARCLKKHCISQPGHTLNKL